MSQTPEEIRAEIEATRAELASDVEDLNEKVNPARVVERKVDSAKETVIGMRTTVKEKVMGTTDTVTGAGGSLKEKVMGAGESLSGATSGAAGSAADTVRQAPTTAKQRAAGNPLVAGAVAFGVGYLLSTLLPASTRERQAAEAVKDQAASLKEPVKQQLSSVASEMKEELQPAAQEAVATVKETATDAAQTVKETASDAGTTVTEQAKQSGQAVGGQASQSASNVKQAAGSSSDEGVYEDEIVVVEAYPSTPSTSTTRSPSVPPV